MLYKSQGLARVPESEEGNPMNLRRLTEELDMNSAAESAQLEDLDMNLREIWSSYLAHNDEVMRKESAARQPLAQAFGDKLVA